ncbi:MAG TPA: bifunctional 3-deoxy-7-phosphoheptulonate synthase/chorismate mutase [Clostridia bacterium]|nr:bifunctional 3-deoxy-7-phosphoheptulonate synthase/chorismate mutase [Clostridia bacterium]
MASKINYLRDEIDRVNLEMLRLLNTRTSLVKEIGELKDEKGLDYFDPMRETQMLAHILKQNDGPLQNELVKEVFSAIFSTSLKYMGIKREKKLLISSHNDNAFLSISEMFNLKPEEPVIIAGPCAVEKAEYLESIAVLLKKNNIKFLRAGAFKPRTSPYEFQGLKKEGLEILYEVGKKYDLITVTEVVDTRDVGMVSEYADVLQVGARNMHNFELLKEVGNSKKPVLLKRGMSATIQELFFAAEYIGLQGNRQIILCERGIRTFETKTRNTLDIASVPIIKKETTLPVLVDLSHSLGRKDIINYIAKAALSAGADGIMLEVHPYPELALSDSKQQLNPSEFEDLLKFIK